VAAAPTSPLTLPALRSLPEEAKPGIAEPPSRRMFEPGNWGRIAEPDTHTARGGNGFWSSGLLNLGPHCPPILGFRAWLAPPGPEGLTRALLARRRGSVPSLRRPARARFGDPLCPVPHRPASPPQGGRTDPPAAVNPVGAGEHRGPQAARAGSHFLRGAGGAGRPAEAALGAFPVYPCWGERGLSPGTTRQTWED
jgi:hypothetical protein